MIELISYAGAAAVGIAAGSVFARFANIPYLWIFIFGIFFVLVPLSFALVTKYVKNKNVWVIFVIPAFFYTGWLVTEVKTDTALRPLYPFMGEVEISGTIISPPVKYDENTSFVMETDYVKSGECLNKVREKIKVSTSGNAANIGSSIIVKGELKPVSLPKNSTSFDSNTHNKRRGVFFSVFTETVKLSREKCSLSAMGRVKLFINTTTDLFIQRFPSSSVPIIKAMVLNNKSEIPDETLEAMLRSGTYRYLYCPYLHISVLIYILHKIFGDKKRGIYAGICIFLIYLFMNITIPSAWKICLFFGFSYMLMVVFKISDIRVPMYLTVIFTALASPLTLTEPGFVISICATIIVRCFNHHLRGFLYSLFHHRKLAGFLALYLTIMVGVYPISSFYGFPITPWSMVMGLVLIPLAAVIYGLFYLSYVIFLISGNVITLGVPSLALIMEKASHFASELPFASFSLGTCSLLFVITCYAVLYSLYRRLTDRRSVLSEILSGLLCIVFAAVTIYGINDAELTFLSVGNSDCSIITLPRGKTIMVDGGGSPHYSSYDIGEAEVIPYLEAHGINKIDTVIVSHYDKDHADGIVTVMKHMPVGEIFMPDYLPNNDYRDIIEDEAKKQNTKLNFVAEETTALLKAGVKCEFLCGTGGLDENDSSLVARLNIGGASVLFTGDISAFAEQKLTSVKADIVKVPHHGSKYSSSESFIKSAASKFGVICVGDNNPYGHPSKEVLSRYEKQGTEILRTDLLGDIHFIIGKSGIKRIYSFRERFIYGVF